METAALISLLAALTIATVGWLLTSMRAEARAGQRALLAELQALRAEVQANRQAIVDLGVRLDGRIDEVIARFDDRFEVEGKRFDDMGKRLDDLYGILRTILDQLIQPARPDRPDQPAQH